MFPIAWGGSPPYEGGKGGGRMISAPTFPFVGAFFERPRANTVRPYEGERVATGGGGLRKRTVEDAGPYKWV